VRRADRLFQIVHRLQSRRTLTAGDLAEELGVSVRTVYRDVADLVESGVPVEGEAGVGYRLARGFQLPPLTFDREEIEALVAGARLIGSVADPALGEAATRALGKIEAVLPPPLREALLATAMFAPRSARSAEGSDRLEVVRAAISDRRKLRIAYTRGDGAASERVIRPVGLYYFGGSWAAAAWCELRGTWRSFRLDRMRELAVLADTFSDETTLSAFVRHLEAEVGESLTGFGPRR
jgi:predicted DNA-binding transcriptional regulator YafY